MITRHGTYIDGFAGPQQPSLPETWAARLVIETEPRWLRSFLLCDQDPAKVNALEALKAEQPVQPQRTILIFSGDFNDRVADMLSAGHVGPTVATFCLLDQRTFECEWQTVVQLAAHKPDNKIELFYFVPTGWLHRALSGLSDSAVVDRWWGGSGWQVLSQSNQYECAQIFCSRFRDELGYKYAHPWPIYDKQGRNRVMYHMVHATDHPEAPNLMARAYRRATDTPEPLEQLELEFSRWKLARTE